MQVGDEIISTGGHRAYVTRVSHKGVDALSCFNGGMLSIRANMIGHTWKATGNRHHTLARIVKEIQCSTQRAKS